MSEPVRLVVISENGRLVGTHVPGGGRHEPKGPAARIVAGPGQTLHEIEIERPTDLSRPGAVDAFHELVRRKTNLK
jgi:hypothetical protein